MNIYKIWSQWDVLQEPVLPGGGSWGVGTSTHCWCPVCGTEERAGAKALVQKPVHSRFISSISKPFTRLPVMGWWRLELHEGCRTTCFFFSARFLPTPPEQRRLQKSSKPVAKVAVLCSPYKGGMPRTCTNMSLLPITFSWSRTVFFFIPEAMWCYSLDHWLWSWLCMYWWGIFCLLIALQHSLLACTPSTCSIALIYEQDTWEVWSFHIICTEIVLPSF